MILTAPRKVKEFVANSLKVKEKKPRAPRNAASRATKEESVLVVNKRVQLLQEATNFVSEEDDLEGEEGAARKRTRFSSSGGGGGDDDFEDFDMVGGGVAFVLRAPEKPLPLNFYEVAFRVFNEFWTLEFEDADTDLRISLFAKINSSNCKEYNLEHYSESSSSLADIYERLEATLNIGKPKAKVGGALKVAVNMTFPYRSTEDFFSDFRAMFDNIYIYYPKDGKVFAKILELDALFNSRWEEALKRFIQAEEVE